MLIKKAFDARRRIFICYILLLCHRGCQLCIIRAEVLAMGHVANTLARMTV